MSQLDAEKTTQFFTAIGDPNRLQILFVLGGKRLNVTEIASQFTVSRPAISHHLKVLRDARIIRSEKVGQEVYYWIDKPFLVDTLRDTASLLEAYVHDDEVTPP